MNQKKETSRLVIFPRVVIALFFIVISFGLLGTWLPAFGLLPALGKNALTLDAWRSVFTYPGFSRSITSTLISGFGATVISTATATIITSLTYGSAIWRALEKSLAPILSIPHAAFAIGLGFLIAPSGWLLRIISPELTGIVQAPDWIITKDPYGLSLMATLCLKEIPFLLLIIIGALSRLGVNQVLTVGRSLGYQPVQIWIKIIIPRLYPHIRLSVFAVLAYSLSVVDVAMIIGPTVPPTFAVLILSWFNDPDLNLRLTGAAGATLLLVIVISGIAIFFLLEKVYQRISRRLATNGSRVSIVSGFRPLGYSLTTILLGFTSAAFIILVIWSFAWRWRFPDFLPGSWSTRFWIKGLNQAGWPILNTISTGLASAFIAISLTIGCLEYEVFLKKAGKRINLDRLLWITYLPLIVPQIAFIFGIQVILTTLRVDGRWFSLVWSHLLFVYPYVFLTLSASYRDFDDRISQLATILSRSTLQAFWKIKLPILIRPILFSFAIGFSVSVSQYIPTIFVGAGRFVTITTEAVSLAGGSDRRIVAVYALFQQLLPLIVFVLALFIPKALFINRRGMKI